MKLLKKIGLFVVLFVTLSQVLGISTSRFEEKLFVVENHESDQPANENISSMTCTCVSLIEQTIVEKECHFHTSFNLTFWQPPKNS
jgi:hypothetical protein